MAKWPNLETWKQPQWFLGFANFYLLFIRDYSKVDTLLTHLTSSLSPFQWSATFDDLMCPVFVQPDLVRQFIVKVDASDTGGGAILFHCAESNRKLHPCSFFSRCLSSAESNYAVGNMELVVFKLPLESGSKGPFVVWMDQTAKHLNYHQAWWVLFF